MNAGDMVKITKPTYLYKGVFILQNSIVEILAITDINTANVLYRDREGNPHEISFLLTDLSPS